MKIKDNDYYKNLYVRLLKAYDLKRNNNTQVAMYNIYSKINHHYKNHAFKNLIYECFNRNGNIEDFGFQFNSEEELLNFYKDVFAPKE